MRVSDADLPTIGSLDELAELVAKNPDLYVRWSRGPDADADQTSRDDLSGAKLPGLSANPLAVEEWWGDRPLRTWVARRLHDYTHLQQVRGPGVRAWVLTGRETGRGPDNEPLVECDQALAWVDERVVAEAESEVSSEADPDPWGPLRRY